MRFSLLLLVTLLFCGMESLPGQDAGAIRLIVMADDMGAAQGVNAGTIQAYRSGVVRTTNVIVPGPWMLDAVAQLKENPRLDVGVHLTLTSEWEFVKWRPLTFAPSLVDENGYFFPMVRRNASFPPKSSMEEAGIRIEEAEKELRAQIEMAKRLIPRVSYITPHMGAAVSTPELRKVTEKLSAEFDLPIFMSIQGVKPLGSLWRQTDSGEEKATALAAKLEEIGPGTWWMLDHAALDNDEMRAIGHLGYRNVAQDRYANVIAWTSKEVKEVVRKRKIQLIGWADLIRERKAATK